MVSFPQARVCLFARPPVPAMTPRRLSRSDLASSSMGEPCPSLQPHPFPFSECLAVTVTSRGLSSNQCDEPPRVRSSALVVRQFPPSLGRFPFMRVLTVDGMEAALVYDFLPTTPAYAAAALDSSRLSFTASRAVSLTLSSPLQEASSLVDPSFACLLLVSRHRPPHPV